MYSFDITSPTRIIAEKNGYKKIGEITKKYGAEALLVTGRSSLKKSGLEAEIIKLLESSGISITLFDGVETNPTRQKMNEGGKTAKKAGIDVVVGVGGGSVLDTAKGIAAIAGMGLEDVWDFVGGKKATDEVLPIVAIPTTAGTGSEVTPYTVISDFELELKEGFMSQYTIPKVAILDPLVMKSATPELTANAGIDAFAHAAESYLTKLAHPLSDMYGMQAVKLIFENLEKACKDPDDLDARMNMALASTLAGIAISYVDVIIAHHASEAIGAVFHTHHGLTAGILLIPAIEFNYEECKEKLYSLGVAIDPSISALTVEDGAHRTIKLIKNLYSKIGIPENLGSIGVNSGQKAKIMAIMENRMGDLKAGNPKEMNMKSIDQFITKVL